MGAFGDLLLITLETHLMNKKTNTHTAIRLPLPIQPLGEGRPRLGVPNAIYPNYPPSGPAAGQRDRIVPLGSGEKRTEPLLTEPQAAKFLAISPRKLATLRRIGEIRHIASGRSIRYDMTDIQDWISRHRQEGDASRN